MSDFFFSNTPEQRKSMRGRVALQVLTLEDAAKNNRLHSITSKKQVQKIAHYTGRDGKKHSMTLCIYLIKYAETLLGKSKEQTMFNPTIEKMVVAMIVSEGDRVLLYEKQHTDSFRVVAPFNCDAVIGETVVYRKQGENWGTWIRTVGTVSTTISIYEQLIKQDTILAKDALMQAMQRIDYLEECMSRIDELTGKCLLNDVAKLQRVVQQTWEIAHTALDKSKDN